MTTASLRFSERLYDAVFGGPVLPEAEVRDIIASVRLSLPALVCFVPEGGRLTEERLRREGLEKLPKGKGGAIDLPSVGRFWFIPAQQREERYFAHSPERVIYAMQQAIVRQRREELELWADAPPRGLSLQEETEALALALQEVRRNGVAGEATGLWTRVVLYRHHLQINAVRLCMVEFLTSLTRGRGASVAYASAALIRAIYREHTLTGLRSFPVRIAGELMPLLAGQQAGGERTKVAHPLLPRVLSYMTAHFREGIGLAEVAQACHVSPEHLARLFRKETGQTIVSYLQHLRVQQACELLVTTSKPLLEVALDSGFESVEHFHRLFRRLRGVTPRAYRLAYR